MKYEKKYKEALERAKEINREHFKKGFGSSKVEPKFKVGDWIVNKTCGSVYRVESILLPQSKCYYLSHNGGIVLVSFTDEQNYRLWSIEDAKDGDVLFYDDGWTCIFKNIHGIWYSSYCFITADGEFNKGYERHAIDAKINGHVHPATKEQRDLLFQKMKEAGYTFDFEKKELKKIEYKPAEWEPQIGDTFRKKGTISPTYYLCDKLEDGITFDFVENREVGIMGGEITIFALKQDYELVERLKPIEKVIEEELNKALQTKVEPKPSWSEEDENIRQWLISEIEKLLAQFIKSTKAQTTWKPSDLQIEALESATENCAYSEYVDCLKELIEQLKQL